MPLLPPVPPDAEARELRETLRRRIDFLRGDFTLASGKKSDFYINGKTTTLRPDALYAAARLMLASMAPERPDRAGGMTLGADALTGALTALSHLTGQGLEGFIVRKEPKGHGTGQWMEGPPLAPGARVAVVEDVVTTGKSALEAVDRIRQERPEAVVLGVWALVDRLDGGAEALRAAGLPLRALFTKEEL